MNDENDKDWKLKLRYGKLTTPFQHYTLIGGGLVADAEKNGDCPAGPAFLAIIAIFALMVAKPELW